MAFIDLLINETEQKFALGNKSIAIVSALISTMNNSEIGGVEGFLDRFREAGLTTTVDAWVNDSEEISLTPNDIELSLEPSIIQELSHKTGFKHSQLTEVLAYLIPPIICHLAAKRASLAMPPDEMRKALWTVTNESEPELEIADSAESKPFSSPLQPLSSMKVLSGKLLRSLHF